MAATYAIGIDLGTTNSVIAYAALGEETPRVQVLPVPQLVAPATAEPRNMLPSFLYLPGAADFPAGSTALPWDANPAAVVGRLAQKRGIENVGRMVSSAKSWLSHSGVDRTSPLLPFRAPEGVANISPVETCRRYLEPLIAGEDYPPYRNGLPAYVRIKGATVKRKLTNEFKL